MEVKEIYNEVNNKADNLMIKIMSGYFVFGLVLAFYYDTWLIGIVGGVLAFGLFIIAKLLFPGKKVHHYVAGITYGLFMAQFIYQMHGMFEMHFTAFIALIVLLYYQNFRVLIPIVLLVVVHHAGFAYIQYYGYVNEVESYSKIYFTQMDYMDLYTFIIHASLFAVAAFFAGWQAYQVEKLSNRQTQGMARLEKENNKNERNIAFANEIAKGNFEYEYQLQESDELGQSLVEMRTNLIEGYNREKREKFIAQGKAQIGDLLRDNINNIENLSDKIVSFLVKYVGVNQGALFIVSDQDHEDKVLKLKGCYAYDRKKFIDKSISWGQGLVGQCAIEQEPIYMIDVPEDYVNITSGLGDANPRSVFLIPIANDEKVVGVLEIAAFNELDAYQMDFLKQVGTDIAAAIINLQTNQKMQLLYQESQKSTEELRSQEEEMRQNMEELSATQEEMKRYSLETEEKLKALDKSEIALLEIDGQGMIISANNALLQMLNYGRSDELINKNYSTISSRPLDLDAIHNVTDNEVWQTSGGKAVEVKVSYSAIQFNNNKADKIIVLAHRLVEKEVEVSK